MTRALNLIGQRFGALMVVERYAENTRLGKSKWLCRCGCGTEIVAVSGNLTHGNTKSCGCMKAAWCGGVKTSHGMSRHRGGAPSAPEYNSWCGMIARCENPNAPKYADYGGRGITVCDRRRDSFETFFEDMGPRPTPGHSIDRIDVDGNYEPGNCRWATAKVQANNQRRHKEREAHAG